MFEIITEVVEDISNIAVVKSVRYPASMLKRTTTRLII